MERTDKRHVMVQDEGAGMRVRNQMLPRCTRCWNESVGAKGIVSVSRIYKETIDGAYSDYGMSVW